MRSFHQAGFAHAQFMSCVFAHAHFSVRCVLGMRSFYQVGFAHAQFLSDCFYACAVFYQVCFASIWCFYACAVGEVDFWIFFIFNFLQFAIDGKNNSKTKVEKVFFFIFMSSYAEMS
jgi:hypothetical protein